MSSKFTVYKTTNLINGKIYVGCHVTLNPDDSYLGSGKILIQAIFKYGIENFSKEILFVYDNPEEMFLKESEIVDSDFVKSENTYNIKIGGEGGWDFILRNKSNWSEERRKLHSIEMKKRKSLGLWGCNTDSYGMKGKHHSIKAKSKISENNGNKLSEEVIKSRLDDLKEFSPTTRGTKNKLAQRWGISHTSVKRFVEKHLGCLV